MCIRDSGIAALAQSLAQQGQLAAQRSAANIGQQEATNQRMAAQQAGQIQAQERRGEIISRQQQRDQIGTLLGMSQSEVAAAREQQRLAQKAKMDAISKNWKNSCNLKPIPLLLPSNSTTNTIFQINDIPPLADAIK